ncbi:MAG: hypothetical protein KF868_20425 [Acidobacteria bacterium]|nr:hypothetical protein [Acidobacteriota bacterium]
MDLLFARVAEQPGSSVFCESSSVLFEAATAGVAYDRALEWAGRHTEHTDFEFVGVRHIHSLDDTPGDGVEVGGRFFEDVDPWERRDELIPPRHEIPVIVFEANPTTPVGRLLDEDTEVKIQRFFSGTE